MCATWEDVPARLACRAESLLQVWHFRLYNCASAHVMESQKKKTNLLFAVLNLSRARLSA